MKRKTKIIITSITALTVALLCAALIITAPMIELRLNARKYELAQADLSARGDRIYFLNTNSADAILIESEGRFALIEAAEDSDNPRNLPGLVFQGTEDYVADCIKQIAGDENGHAVLEFVLGTHCHSDHIGGFDTIISDEAITVKKAYLKKYDESLISDYEVENWDNKEVYEQMVSACKKYGVELIQDIPTDSFMLGNFKITFYNTEAPTLEKVGENENSIGVLAEKNGCRAFLAADINNYDGDEDKLAAQIGKINLLKVAHHGYEGSTSENFVNALKPEIAIVTNTIYGLCKPAMRALNSVDSSVYATKESNGVIADFGENGITLYKNIELTERDS